MNTDKSKDKSPAAKVEEKIIEAKENLGEKLRDDKSKSEKKNA